MSVVRNASAPHAADASRIALPVLTGAGPGDVPARGLTLYARSEPPLHAQIVSSSPGTSRLELDCDLFVHVVAGEARCRSDGGDTLDVRGTTLLHLKHGWRGEVEVIAALRGVILRLPGEARGDAHVLPDPANAAPLSDWGEIPTLLEGASRTSGILLDRDADGGAESGVWVCTAGRWRCEVNRDELCHFLAGHCTYTHDSGEAIEIHPDTAAFFPRGWHGVCEVHDTVRKVYCIA